MLKAVLFDLDDTLVDQEGAADAAVVAFAAEHGIHDVEVRRRWSAISAVHYGRYQRREVTFAEQRRARVRELLSLDVSDDDADDLFGGYLRRYEAGWTLFDDAVPALRRARSAGLAVVVLTNGDEEQQRRKLRLLGLEDEVSTLVASSSLPAGKPDQRAFRGALARVGVHASEALMVGDSLEDDVRGALRAGLGAVLVDRTGDGRAGHGRTNGVRTVSSLDDVTFGDTPRP
ncbi:HAD family hydrolase [Nocardioides sp. AX2bis]|uniref:HAD family hydrolase n=1 Tax=Nocardioides sp. AX2bis TaxID=2653157 RepID=UPI0012F08A67|nr:HAD family hydrolase [Nocardioides sp. AX2bis]VXB35209.1 Haloacid dehalogenase [Nocardioides sp. AX2bis]